MAIQPAAATVRSGNAAILLAATIWGTTGTAQSFVLDRTTPLSIGAARIVLGGLILLCLALAMRRTELRDLLGADRGVRSRLLLAAGAVAVVIYQIAFFASVARTGVVVGTVVTIGSGPVFAGLIAWARGRPQSARWAFATAGAAAGCTALVSGGDAAGVAPSGVVLALLSGLGYAVYATVAGHLIAGGANDLAVIGSLFGGAGLLLVPVLTVSGTSWLGTTAGLSIAVYLGAVTTAGGYLLYARGLRTTSVPNATTLTMAEPAVAAVLGLVVLGEQLGPVALAGLGLVAVSLLLLIRR